MKSSKGKKSLLQQLKRASLCLCTAMMGVWFLFYIYMNRILKNYTIQNMEQVSVGIIDKLNQSFLELQEISFAMTDNEAVSSFLQEENPVAFYRKAEAVDDKLDTVIGNTMLANNILLYTEQGKYYRFIGNISNAAAQRIYYNLQREEIDGPIRITLEGISYIVYADSVSYKGKKLGKIVMLLDETDINRMFAQASNQKNMKIGLAVEGVMVATNEKEWMNQNVDEIANSTKYLVHTKVGFTPFELFVVYEKTSQELSLLFLLAIIGTAFILWFIIRQFVASWRGKFFEPISRIIQGVSELSGVKGEQITLTGMEHFDLLVQGINDMLYRIEEKEAALFSTAILLKEGEIKRQKALIISLKKQINAHFTVNVLNVIKALGEQGDNEKAGLMCDGLSYLLRYANGGEEYISLMEELFILEKYIGLMKIRFPGRFVAEVDVEDDFADIYIPRMLVQPIVENSILHGYEDGSLEDRDCINIHIWAKIVRGDARDVLQVIVKDNGCGMSERKRDRLINELKSEGDDVEDIAGLSHIALKNIQRRICSYFGEDYGIQIDSEYSKGTKVIVLLPIVTNMAYAPNIRIYNDEK